MIQFSNSWNKTVRLVQFKVYMVDHYCRSSDEEVPISRIYRKVNTNYFRDSHFLRQLHLTNQKKQNTKTPLYTLN